MWLPRTFAKNYYHPLEQIYRKPAASSFKWRNVSIGAIKWRSDFYTIAHSEGTDNTSLEGFFGRIETHVPRWLRDEGVNPIDRGEKEYWLAWFIATQGQRTPYAAKVRRAHNPSTPVNMPIGALIAANLTEAKSMARKIFSWHWQMRKLDVHQSKEELLLGETCVFDHPLNQGLIFNIRRQTILLCSPLISTQCETMTEASKEEELKWIHGLNNLTISAAFNGFIYRATQPVKI